MLSARVLLSIAAVALSGVAFACQVASANDRVAVSSAVDAIALAKVAWAARFSPEQISKYEPYHAELRAGVWEVSGHMPADTLGGTPTASICQVTGVVQKVAHGQ